MSKKYNNLGADGASKMDPAKDMKRWIQVLEIMLNNNQRMAFKHIPLVNERLDILEKFLVDAADAREEIKSFEAVDCKLSWDGWRRLAAPLMEMKVERINLEGNHLDKLEVLDVLRDFLGHGKLPEILVGGDQNQNHDPVNTSETTYTTTAPTTTTTTYTTTVPTTTSTSLGGTSLGEGHNPLFGMKEDESLSMDDEGHYLVIGDVDTQGQYIDVSELSDEDTVYESVEEKKAPAIPSGGMRTSNISVFGPPEYTKDIKGGKGGRGDSGMQM